MYSCHMWFAGRDIPLYVAVWISGAEAIWIGILLTGRGSRLVKESSFFLILLFFFFLRIGLCFFSKDVILYRFLSSLHVDDDDDEEDRRS